MHEGRLLAPSAMACLLAMPASAARPQAIRGSMPTPFARLSAALADRYRIERELGQGGMATVYLAHDVRHDRKVANYTIARLREKQRDLPRALAAIRRHETDGFPSYLWIGAPSSRLHPGH